MTSSPEKTFWVSFVSKDNTITHPVNRRLHFSADAQSASLPTLFNNVRAREKQHQRRFRTCFVPLKRQFIIHKRKKHAWTREALTSISVYSVWSVDDKAAPHGEKSIRQKITFQVVFQGKGVIVPHIYHEEHSHT